MIKAKGRQIGWLKKGGNYLFDVAEKRGSAGSTSLVLQTLVPALVLAGHPAKITLKGGTHVPWNPLFHYLKEIFIPLINIMGCSLDLTITKWGSYPIGGGEVHGDISFKRT